MSKAEVVLICPLGSKCEDARDGKIYRCAWFVRLAGKNPTTGELQDEEGCAMGWVPILLIENSQQQRSTSAAVESFRNEVVRGNEAASAAMQALASGLPAPATPYTHQLTVNG
jgi:hypothetical protein